MPGTNPELGGNERVAARGDPTLQDGTRFCVAVGYAKASADFLGCQSGTPGTLIRPRLLWHVIAGEECVRAVWLRCVLKPDHPFYAERPRGAFGRPAERHRANASGVRGQGREGKRRFCTGHIRVSGRALHDGRSDIRVHARSEYPTPPRGPSSPYALPDRAEEGS